MTEVKELLTSCRKQLANRNSDLGGDVVEAFPPRFPLISVFWPGTSAEGREAAEQAIEDLWPIHASKMRGIDGTTDAEELVNRVKTVSSSLSKGVGELDFVIKNEQIIVHYLSTDSKELSAQLEAICESAGQSSFGVNVQHIILVLFCNHDKDPKQAHQGMLMAAETTKKD